MSFILACLLTEQLIKHISNSMSKKEWVSYLKIFDNSHSWLLNYIKKFRCRWEEERRKWLKIQDTCILLPRFMEPTHTYRGKRSGSNILYEREHPDSTALAIVVTVFSRFLVHGKKSSNPTCEPEFRRKSVQKLTGRMVPSRGGNVGA